MSTVAVSLNCWVEAWPNAEHLTELDEGWAQVCHLHDDADQFDSHVSHNHQEAKLHRKLLLNFLIL